MSHPFSDTWQQQLIGNLKQLFGESEKANFKIGVLQSEMAILKSGVNMDMNSVFAWISKIAQWASVVNHSLDMITMNYNTKPNEAEQFRNEIREKLDLIEYNHSTVIKEHNESNINLIRQLNSNFEETISRNKFQLNEEYSRMKDDIDSMKQNLWKLAADQETIRSQTMGVESKVLSEVTTIRENVRVCGERLQISEKEGKEMMINKEKNEERKLREMREDTARSIGAAEDRIMGKIEDLKKRWESVESHQKKSGDAINRLEKGVEKRVGALEAEVEKKMGIWEEKMGINRGESREIGKEVEKCEKKMEEKLDRSEKAIWRRIGEVKEKSMKALEAVDEKMKSGLEEALKINENLENYQKKNEESLKLIEKALEHKTSEIREATTKSIGISSEKLERKIEDVRRKKWGHRIFGEKDGRKPGMQREESRKEGERDKGRTDKEYKQHE